MFKNFGSLLLLLFINITSHAQKLPNKQGASVWLPPNFKIDGKTDEWDGQLQAHNHATEVYYTIANDNDNLYIAFRSADPDVVQKITDCGITFTVQRKGYNDIDLTYPVLEKGAHIRFILRDHPNISKDSAFKVAPLDMKMNNEHIQQAFKVIVAKGISGIDTLLSVYNDNGIKVAGRMDIARIYTQEMIIPLKLLGMTATTPLTISYRVTVNGSKRIAELKHIFTLPANATPEQIALVDRAKNDAPERQAKISTSTDFDGKYTFAKKP